MPLHIGLSSWTDKSLILSGKFYPRKSMKSRERLRFYTLFFDTAEVNASFYSFPAQSWIRNWTENTPPDFKFGIKAYSLLTFHPVHAAGMPVELKELLPGEIRKELSTSWKELSKIRISPSKFPEEAWDFAFEKFQESIKPLEKKKKVAYVIFQFGFWWFYRSERLDYILSLKERLPGYKIAVEFRHRSWLPKREKEIIKIFQENGITLVSVDCPETEKSIPSKLYLTDRLVVIRFHGRNKEAWEKSLKAHSGVTVEERYDYEYFEDDLVGWVKEIQEIEPDHEVYVQFNNNARWYPASSAMRMNNMLGRGISWEEHLKRLDRLR